MENKEHEDKKVLRSFSGKVKSPGKKIPAVIIAVLVVLAGVGTGRLLSKGSNKSSTSSSTVTTSNVTQTANEAGIADTSAFSESDAPIGILQEGGIKGEGTYHLERPGGPSQNVYLTSTVIDLKSFVGKKVQVWGQTISGQSAGWLMDVGKIKVVN